MKVIKYLYIFQLVPTFPKDSIVLCRMHCKKDVSEFPIYNRIIISEFL